MLKEKPLVFHGAISHWPALGKWTNAYLMDILRDSDSRANNLFEFNSNYKRNRLSNHTVKTGFEQVLYGDKASKFYLARQPLRNKEEKLIEDIQVPDWIKNKIFHQPNLWAGQNLSLSPLHYDSTDGYLCQIAGYKRVYLFSPDDSLYLYPMSPLTNGQFNLSQISHVHNAPVDIYPEFLHATTRSILLKPGDSLYIPQGWWHQVFNIGHSVAVNFFFTDKIKGFSPKQEILRYQACKNSEKPEIDHILNRGNYESCLDNAFALSENNSLEYACYFALTYFEEYLKAKFIMQFFSEFTITNDAMSNELQSLAICLFNSRQSESESYYRNLEQANNHLKKDCGWHIPDPFIKKWINLSQKMLLGHLPSIKSEDIKLLLEEIKAFCVPSQHTLGKQFSA